MLYEIMQFTKTYYIMLTVILGVLIFIRNNSHEINLKRVAILKLSLFITLLIAIIDWIERYYASLQPSAGVVAMRTILSFIAYSTKPLPLVLMVLLFKKRDKLYYLMFIPEIMNILVYSTCFFNGLAFVISDNNHWIGGPLCRLVFIVCAVYMVDLIIGISSSFRGDNKAETITIILFCVATQMAGIIESADYESHVLFPMMAIGSVFFYLCINTSYSKTDALTGLLNRQTYYTDIERREKEISAVVTLDMNGLKLVNDNEGHEAGDRALVAIANAIGRSISRTDYAYRVGGDEFVILCFKADEADVKKLVSSINSAIEKEGYTCSIGYGMTDESVDLNEAIKISDYQMYKVKNKFYAHLGIRNR